MDGATGGGSAAARFGTAAGAVRMPPARRSASVWLDRQFARLAVLPTTVLMLLVFGLPLLFSLYLSFQGWSPDQALFGGRFSGFDNYQDLLTDPAFVGSLGITFGYTAVTVATELAAGLGLALLLNIDLPWINGIVDYIIGSHIIWLGRPDTALVSVAVVNLWQNAPYVAVLLLAGLRSLPSEPIEAAAIDGASRLQVFWHITLPLLRPYIVVALLLRTIFEFRAFDNIYVMTSGGPADATMVLSMFTYLASFVRFDLSLGAAASWMMLLMSMGLCLLFIAVIRRREAL
jgi:multiple sugar transport system permease protein